MNTAWHLAAAVVLAVCFTVARPASANSQVLILENLVLIDGTGDDARAVSALVVDDGRVVAIANAAAAYTVPDVEAARRVDLGGAVVIPGLIDTHVHVARFPDTRNAAAAILAQALRGGVTAVRDMGGDVRALNDLARAQASDEFLGPTVVASAVVGGPTLFADPRIARLGVGFPAGAAPWTRALTADLDLRLAVAEAKGAGAAGLKLYGDLPASLVVPLVAEARRQGLGTWAHATVFPARPGDLVSAASVRSRTRRIWCGRRWTRCPTATRRGRRRHGQRRRPTIRGSTVCSIAWRQTRCTWTPRCTSLPRWTPTRPTSRLPGRARQRAGPASDPVGA